MTKLLLPLCLFLLVVSTRAQLHPDTTKVNTGLFEKFIDGTVLMKSGAVEKAPLNYDVYTQSITFLKNDQVMTLVGLSEVDTIYIADKKFIPANDIVFEIIPSSDFSGPYITYTGKLRPLTATVGHDGGSRRPTGEVSNTVTGSYVNRIYQEHYKMEIRKTYWVRKGDAFYKANNEKQFLKVQTSKAGAAIRSFINQYNIKFDNQDDMIRLFAFSAKQ